MLHQLTLFFLYNITLWFSYLGSLLNFVLLLVHLYSLLMTRYRFYLAAYSHVCKSLLLYISFIKDQPIPMHVRKLDKCAHVRLCTSHLSVVPSNCWHIGMHNLIVHDIGVFLGFQSNVYSALFTSETSRRSLDIILVRVQRLLNM